MFPLMSWQFGSVSPRNQSPSLKVSQVLEAGLTLTKLMSENLTLRQRSSDLIMVV